MSNKIVTVNPHNGEVIKEYVKHTSGEIERIISNATKRQIEWARKPFPARAEFFLAVADLLLKRKEQYARLMAEEMGKPISQGIAEIEKCARVCHYYVENSEKFLADKPVETEAKKSYVTYNPLGIILGIMPWNFPFWQVFRFAVPTLMAGNAVLMKHSSNVMGCSLAIEYLLLDAGIPENVFSSLVISGEEAEELIGNINIAAVSLTGSTQVGQRVTAVAGKYMKKCVMELGGSDPYLVLKDADIDKAAKICAAARLINSGQSCIAAKRFIVEADVYDEFLEKFTREMASYKMGNPLESDTAIGPQARADLRDELHNLVEKTIEFGGKLHLGGELPEGPGYYYPATIVTGVMPGMPLFDEESFGPVAAVTRAEREDLAISLCNFSKFGLGAAIFTEDLEKAEHLAKNVLNAGTVYVNGQVKSDPRLPFGGIKESGYGRELSEEGIKEFVNIKTVVIE